MALRWTGVATSSCALVRPIKGACLTIPSAGGPLTSPPFSFTPPMSIAADGSGNLFVGDQIGLFEIPAAGGYTTINIIYEVPTSSGTVLLASRWTGAGTSFFPPKSPILYRSRVMCMRFRKRLATARSRLRCLSVA